MIGKALPYGRGFLHLARYLEKGHAGEERERVAFIESRNLPTEDPETAARLMAAHARESIRTQRPVYHLVISCDPGDPVDRASMSRVADSVLRELGLSEHQVLIVAHNDTEHPHMHLIVNRVHPETHLAWENRWDWPKIEKALRAEEVALGFRIVPGKHAAVPGREPPAPKLAPGDPAFLRDVQERAGPVLAGAQSWAEVEQGLSGLGLAVRVKGGGLSINDGRQEVKGSDVDRAFSRTRMEARLGKLSAHRLKNPPQQPAPVLAPTRATDPPPVVQPPSVSVPTPPQQAPRQAPRAHPEAEPPAVPTPPAPPSPEERFREVLQAERQRLHGTTPPEVREAIDLIRQAAEWFDSEPLLHAHQRAVEDAEEQVQRLEKPPAGASSAAADAEALREALAGVYVQPYDAAERLLDFQREHGMDEAKRVLATSPQAFGELRKVYPFWGLGLAYSTGGARDHARTAVAEPLEKAVGSALANEARLRSPELGEARERVRTAKRTLDAARAARNALPSPSISETRAAAILRPLMDQHGAAWIRQQLTNALPPEDRRVAEVVARVGSRLGAVLRDLGRGRGRDRDRGIDR